MHEDTIKSKRIHILLDIIAREGFDFSTAHMHYMLGGHDRDDRTELMSHIYHLREKYTEDCREFVGYSVLFWGYSQDIRAGVFLTKVKAYYEYIGALDYYRGLLDV